MDFSRVTLQAPADRLPSLRDFYVRRLELESPDGDRLRVGAAELAFTPAGGEPFYHFAWLVPGDRFDAALAWAAERADLLPGGDRDEVVFEFDDWDAVACYLHDPAGNILELIAHRGRGHSGARGSFTPRELLGFSELGLVGPPAEMAHDLAELGLALWDGEVGADGQLAFLGEQARTFILSPSGRGWLPTRRPAQPHPVDVVLTGPRSGSVITCGHRVRAE